MDYGVGAIHPNDKSLEAITKVLRCNCEKDYSMSEKFIEYCNKLGSMGSEKKKFWLNVIEI